MPFQQAQFDADIRRHRFHTFEVGVTRARGPVKVSLLRHKFLFGSNFFGLVKFQGDQKALYQQRIGEVWNAGTLPFYWGRYEPQEGQADAEGVAEAARWAAARGFVLKGHPLCWHTVCADWLLDKPADTLLGLQLDRIRREVTAYQDTIRLWDVINEVVILPKFDRYDNAVSRMARLVGPIDLTLACFRAAREANPQARLVINDFNLSEDYARLIETLLDRGCPIDVIGLQTHQHEGYRGPEAVAEYLDRFSRFGLPLHFTENTILSGDLAPKVDDLNDLVRPHWPSTPEGEARQRTETDEFYRQLYAHPLVESIVWWDLEDGNWLNAPGGLVRADLSPKPAFDRLKHLIKTEWGFPGVTLPPVPGRASVFRGPEGEYRVEADGRTWTVVLDRDQPRVVLD